MSRTYSKRSFSTLQAAVGCVLESLEQRRLLAGEGLSAIYYDNENLGAIRLKRTDPVVDFAFADGSPDAAVGADTFSARWTGLITPAFSETYTFHVNADDGARLYIENNLIIDNWGVGGPPAEQTGTFALTGATPVSIRLEYYEISANASVKLEWSSNSQTRQVIPQSALTADAGAPLVPQNLRVTDHSADTVTLAWDHAPDDVFTMGYNVYRNGVKVGPFTPDRVYTDVGLTPGTSYTYTVRALDGVNNLSGLSDPATVTTEAVDIFGVSAVFYDNPDFTTSRAKRVDRTLNADFGEDGPDPSVAPETWSGRWTGRLRPEFSETYTFITTSDDGVRLYINDALLIDNFTIHTATEDTVTKVLDSSKEYRIRVEFFDNFAGAEIKLEWQSASQPREVIPQGKLIRDRFTPIVLAPGLTSKTSSSVTINWPVGNDDVGIMNYSIFRDGVKVGQVRSNQPRTFTDTGLNPAQTYVYQVNCSDYYLNISALSGGLSVTTDAAAGAPAAASTPFSLTAITDGDQDEAEQSLAQLLVG